MDSAFPGIRANFKLLYTHCNAVYGGYNDLRLLAPAVQAFSPNWRGARVRGARRMT